jgi:hypothetical protein
VQTGPFAGRPGTQGRPGADWQFRPRAPHLAPLFRHAFRKGALDERDVSYVTDMGTDVNAHHEIGDHEGGVSTCRIDLFDRFKALVAVAVG